LVGATFVTGTLSSYAGLADVQALLTGYDLSAIGDADALATRIEQLLGPTRRAIDLAAGRDFLYHDGDVALVDGSGHDVLHLRRHGYVPIVAVHSVAVNGQAWDPEGYVVYEAEGYLRAVAPGGSFFASPPGTDAVVFPIGARNVAVTLDWGYPTPPADIVLAQAKLAAAEVLAQAGGAISGGVESQTVGDFSVRYGRDSAYAGTIRRWATEAEDAASRYRGLTASAI
jgi:hypothetical protein